MIVPWRKLTSCLSCFHLAMWSGKMLCQFSRMSSGPTPSSRHRTWIRFSYLTSNHMHANQRHHLLCTWHTILEKVRFANQVGQGRAVPCFNDWPHGLHVLKHLLLPLLCLLGLEHVWPMLLSSLCKQEGLVQGGQSSRVAWRTNLPGCEAALSH